jgi:hypothetical protein
MARRAQKSAAAQALVQERASQRALMARKRALGRDLSLPRPLHPRRRRRCAKDPATFLRTYMGGRDKFWRPFCLHHHAIIDAAVERLRYGGWKALATPRGDGKSSILRGLALWATLFGHRRCVMLIGANHQKALEAREWIRGELERNDLLAEDFPEVCMPIRALEGAAQRASAQTVGGERTFLRWTSHVTVLPTVAGSISNGAIITTVGIEGSILGFNYQGARPDLVLVDDPETRESASSRDEVGKRERILEADVANLGGQERRIAIFYACTVWSAASLAARFTDPKVKPAWSGERLPMLIQKPTRKEAEDLWEHYLGLRLEARLAGDDTARVAHAFYLTHREVMDEGAEVSNPYRYYDTRLPDGSHLQVSALQFCYDLVSDIGWEAFGTEYQQQPPAEQAADMVEVSESAVMKKTSGLDRGILPAGVEFVTAGMDVGGRVLHWTIVAWRRSAGYVIDYGATPVHSPIEGAIEAPENVQAVQDAILAALCEVRDATAAGWPDAGTGELVALRAGLIDVGYARQSMDEPIWALVRAGDGVWRAAKGFGTGSGQAKYGHPSKRGKGRRLFHHAHATYQPARRAWLHNVDADFWKRFVHEGFLAPAERPMSLAVFGRDPVQHRRYAEHILAEIWTHDYKPSKGDVYFWRRVRQRNHWLDATYLACAAAALVGFVPVSAARAAPVAEGAGTPAAAMPPARGGRRRMGRVGALAG